MTTKSRFTTAIATGAVLLNALAPVALASSNDITVSGNGVNSTSNVSVNRTGDTVVNQTNNANITNNVSSNSSSGGNSSSFNTGGDTRIVTGNSTSNVKIDNAANLNKADLSNCNCNGGAYNVTVDGNGVGSDNNVNLDKANQTFLNQNNDANIKNDVDAKAKTGDNDASYNTGGDTIIVTGNAKNNVDVENKANANIATIGGGNGSNGTDGSSVKISGNGAFSDSNVNLDNGSAIVLDQSNNARIRNDVDAKATTGDNSEGFNTGGENAISTGDAKTNVGVSNDVNFNAASVDCDCVLSDANVKVAGNGVGSDNNVDVDAANDLFNTQDNNAGLYNNVDGKAKTGYNDVEFSTGPTNGDPLIYTGNSGSNTDVSNGGNVNLFNNGASINLPGNWDMNVGFDFSNLWNMFAGWNN